MMSYDNYGFGGQNGGFGGFGGYDPTAAALKRKFDRKVRTGILCTSTVVCCGVCFYVLFSNLYSSLINRFPELYVKYKNVSEFASVCDILYSFLCIGLSFSLVYLFFVFFGKGGAEIRLGRTYSGRNTVLLIIAGLGACFVGNVVDSYIINFFGGLGVEFYSFREASAGMEMPESVFGLIVIVFRTAVVPALIEEFAFRGVVLGTLRKYGDGFAIVMSALLFGLMHGNFTQVPFAMIAGIALGFVYVVTGSLWASVTIHFLNNLISVVYSLLSSGSGGLSILVSVVITYGIIFLGALAFGIYLYRNRNGLRLRPSPYASTKGKVLAFCLSPTFLLGGGSLISVMLDDIVR